MKFFGLMMSILLLAIFSVGFAQAGPSPEPYIESVLINGADGKDFTVLADSQFEATIRISESRSNYMILPEFDDQYFDNISEWQDGTTYHIVFDVKDRTGRNEEIKFRIFDGDLVYDGGKTVRFDINRPEAIRFDVISPGDNAAEGYVRFEARVTDRDQEGGELSWRWYVDDELVSSFNGHTAYLEEGVRECHVEVSDELGNAGSQDFVVFVKDYDEEDSGRKHEASSGTYYPSRSEETAGRIDFVDVPESIAWNEPRTLDLSKVGINKGDVVYVNITQEYNEVDSHRYTYRENGEDWLKPVFRFDVTGLKRFRVEVYSGDRCRLYGNFQFRVNREVSPAATDAEPQEIPTVTVDEDPVETEKDDNVAFGGRNISVSPNFKKFINALKWLFE